MEGFILGWLLGQFVDLLIHIKTLQNNLEHLNSLQQNSTFNIDL